MRTVLLFVFSLAFGLFAQTTNITDLDILNGWQIVKADGVDCSFEIIKRVSGNEVKINYNFIKGTGFCGIQKKMPFRFNGKCRFSFYIKGESPSNNLEFKLLDSSRNNVWWSNNRNFEFPLNWGKIVIYNRDIQFAWGPSKDKELTKTDYLEFTIASSNGGKGSVSISNLELEYILKQDSLIYTEYYADENNQNINKVFDIKNPTTWNSISNKPQDVIINFGQMKEYGGLVIDWEENYNAENFEILASDNKVKWEKLYSVNNGNPQSNYIPLKNGESIYLKIKLIRSKGSRFGIKKIAIKNTDFTSDDNNFFMSIAKYYPRGYYPRYLNNESSYWTICGVNSDVKEALINEDGMVEVDKLHFSIEPFIYSDNKIITWNDVKEYQ
jgi:archaellin